MLLRCRARILVCDDHDLIRSLVASTLEGAGHAVVAVASVADAVAELSAGAYDLLVVDLHLRSESGLAVIGHPARAGAPVILLSGDFNERSDRHASRYGADVALPKPFEPDELAAAAQELLTRHSPRPDVAEPGRARDPLPRTAGG